MRDRYDTRQQQLPTPPPLVQLAVRRGIMLMAASYQDIITLEPGKRSGHPTIRGMRITVYNVLSYLTDGKTEQEILADFPYLTEEDIRASLSYAADRPLAEEASHQYHRDQRNLP
jgi:uncharacterized protein (DUF433 family)